MNRLKTESLALQKPGQTCFVHGLGSLGPRLSGFKTAYQIMILVVVPGNFPPRIFQLFGEHVSFCSLKV